jgi:hypothetical protein
MYATFQITLIIIKYVAKPNEKLYTIHNFVEVACKSCIIGPITPLFNTTSIVRGMLS